MATAGQRFPRADRLLRGSEFRVAGRIGRRAVGRHFVMLVASSSRDDGQDAARIGITVSRRVGGAVVRNRVKRRVREWFRRSRESIPRRLDLVVIARRGAGRLDGREIEIRLGELLERAREAA